MLKLTDATLSRGNKVLFENVSLQLHEKQKLGLIGLNGCGKSSLFSLFLGKLHTDHGECEINTQLRISHLAQDIPDSNESALHFVLSGDDAYMQLMQKLSAAESKGDDASILQCHDLLNHSGGYAKPAQAAIILSGLGFSEEEQHLPVNHFSGGWRMRLNLARCLMKPADLYLLDEPTNHLDMEAIYWLENWLRDNPASMLIISHDREFLDGIVTHILHIENKSIKLYGGNYSTFEKTRAMQLALQQATYEKQQTKIAHMMSFVNRFKAKATKAKQAQSRLKMIEKMEVVTQAQLNSPFSMEFFPCPEASSFLLRCDDVAAGYSNESPILKNIHLIVTPGDRIALLGPNGQGKSTVIKTLTGVIAPLGGEILTSAHLKIGYYAQHQLEDLDCNLSPVQTIQKLTPKAREQDIRNYLGGFNFHGDMATNAIHHFSGGEKARLALAKLIWLKPNLLLLDEPTNHLDLEMRSALEIALQSYEGAMILISHDRHLLKSTVDTYYLVYDGKVNEFKGEPEDYWSWLQTGQKEKESTKEKNNAPIYKERKTLQNRSRVLEEQITKYQARLDILDDALSDMTLYEDHKKDTLHSITKEKKELEEKLLQAEEEWMEVFTKLDADF